MSSPSQSVRIAAYYASDDERQSVLSEMRATNPENIREYAGLLEGSVTRMQLDKLLAHNVSLDVLDLNALGLDSRDSGGPRPPQTLQRARDLVADKPTDHRLRQVLESFVLEARAPAFVTFEQPKSARAMYRIHLTERMSQERLTTLNQVGVDRISYAPDNWCRAIVDTDRLDDLRGLAFVDDVAEPTVGDRITADFLSNLERAHTRHAKHLPNRFHLHVNSSDDVDRVHSILERAPGVEVLKTVGPRIRLKADIRSAALAQIVTLPEVGRLSPVLPKAPHSALRASDLVADKPEDDGLRRLLDAFALQARDPAPWAGEAPTRSGIAGTKPRLHFLHFSSVLSQEQRHALKRVGAEILSFSPDNWCRALVPPKELRRLRQLPFVVDIVESTVADIITSDFLRELERAQQPNAEDTRKTLDLTVFHREDVGHVERILRDTAGVEIVETGGATVRLKASILAPFLAPLVALPEIAALATVRPATLLCDFSDPLIGADSLRTATSPLTGHGQIVGIIDSGIDKDHPDLRSRLTASHSVIDTSAVDYVGHGTHVSGIIAGTGEASGRRVHGVAPAAMLAVLKVTNDLRAALPPEMENWLQWLIDADARIVNVSLGIPPADTGSEYDNTARTVDKYVFEHPELLVVVAAGNNCSAPDGDCLLSTISSPGMAKNVITVGASASSRPAPEETWGERNPASFKGPPASARLVTGDPDLIAASSGRGPGSYGLVKPDMVAPGTYILSARPARIKPKLSWLDCNDYSNHYMYVGGSSMAAPFVAGAASLVRQYLQTEVGIRAPSAALLKAILIAATTRLSSERTSGSNSDYGYPDYDQGFGRLDLAKVLPNGKVSARRQLRVVDVANDSGDALESRTPVDAGRRPMRQYLATVALAPTEPLRAALTWTDPPADGVQNHLGLDVIGPDHVRIRGNCDWQNGQNPVLNRPDARGIYWDKLNCVQKVVIDQPVQGDYVVRVIALNTPLPPQGYALAVSAELDGFREITK
jgi:serine protease AprX